jgi:hypothetical protein
MSSIQELWARSRRLREQSAQWRDFAGPEREHAAAVRRLAETTLAENRAVVSGVLRQVARLRSPE